MAVESQRCVARSESGMMMFLPGRWLESPAPPPSIRLETKPRRSAGSCVHDTKDGTTATRRRVPFIDPSFSDSVDRDFNVDRCAVRAEGDVDMAKSGEAACASPAAQISPSFLTMEGGRSGELVDGDLVNLEFDLGVFGESLRCTGPSPLMISVGDLRATGDQPNADAPPRAFASNRAFASASAFSRRARSAPSWLQRARTFSARRTTHPRYVPFLRWKFD